MIIFFIDQKYEVDELYIKKLLRCLIWLMVIIIYCGVYIGVLVRYVDVSLVYGGWLLLFYDLVLYLE